MVEWTVSGFSRINGNTQWDGLFGVMSHSFFASRKFWSLRSPFASLAARALGSHHHPAPLAVAQPLPCAALRCRDPSPSLGFWFDTGMALESSQPIPRGCLGPLETRWLTSVHGGDGPLPSQPQYFVRGVGECTFHRQRSKIQQQQGIIFGPLITCQYSRICHKSSKL